MGAWLGENKAGGYWAAETFEIRPGDYEFAFKKISY